MRWIKHLAKAHNDPAVSGILENCGPVVYGIWWLMLEEIAISLDDKTPDPVVIHSAKKWAQICYCDPRVWTKSAQCLNNVGLILSEPCLDRVKISVPKLLKYRDEYQKKSGHTPDSKAERERERELSSLCMETVQSQKRSRATETPAAPHTNPHPIKSNENQNDNGHKPKPVAIALPGWDKICTAAAKAGMTFDPRPDSEMARICWRPLTLPDQIAAVQGIYKRIECREYDPNQPEYTPKLANYLGKRLWLAALRPHTRIGPPKRTVGAAMTRLAKGATGND